MRDISKKILSTVLRTESRLVLWKYKPKVVAITGSVGKTSTKDALYAALSKMAYVRKSDKSYNSELGLPLTVLGCPNGWNDPVIWTKNILKGLWLFLWPHKYPKWLVLEVGVGKPGDMKTTASWLQTDAVIITAIGDLPSHIEFFKSRDHLIEEKSGLIKTLKKEGVLILNHDDEAVMAMKHKTKSRVVTFGMTEGSDILGSEENILYGKDGDPEGIVFRADGGGNSLPVVIEGLFGKNHVYASLATLAFIFSIKFNVLSAIESLKAYDFPPGRMRILAGINDSTIIDDTYNSSPFACESALRTLGGVKAKGRKIAVLGDMLELGKHTKEAHESIGKLAKEQADVLVAVGPRSEATRDGALSAGMPENNVFYFLNSTLAGEFLQNFVGVGDLVLVKGSQGLRMERAVEQILKDKANKENLLVRQDKEWLAKK
jgi:UDP-N-acetylmuramoyl-tripeptide--D-alanyl-D-alanine ligase